MSENKSSISTVRCLLNPRLSRRRRAINLGWGVLFFFVTVCRNAIADPTVTVIETPRYSRWSNYQIVIWQPKTANQYSSLKRIGITGAAMIIDRRHPQIVPPRESELLKAAGLKWYVENIATDFYSAYHRWFPGYPVDWRFSRAKILYRYSPQSNAAFLRDPSLSDPHWLNLVEKRLEQVVRSHQPDRPLFFDLGDETGVADLNAPWDFDISEPSLRGMRIWLKEQYVTLHALNREWGTGFHRWDQVVPDTTRVAFSRDDENYSSWADFKAWMDVAFAHALFVGTNAVHRADPTAISGIEGVQLPGWGGYNYGVFASSVDLIEAPPNCFALLRSLDRNLILLSTSSGGGPSESHLVWHAFLEGARGVILWDPKNDLVGLDGTVESRGRQLAPVFHELRSGIGALIINSEPVIDPIAILYSQASMRTEWVQYWRKRGDEWARKDTDSENRDNPWRASMRRYQEEVVRAQLRPQFVTTDSVARGAIRRGVRVLILPDTIALSFSAANEIRNFLGRGGTVIANREPGIFDEHSRKLAVPLLDRVFSSSSNHRSHSWRGKAVYLPPATEPIGTEKFNVTALDRLQSIFRDQGIVPKISVTTAGGLPTTDIAVYRFRNGPMTILGLDRISTEDFEPAAQSQANGVADEAIRVHLRGPAFIYDLRTHRLLGRSRVINLVLNRFEPGLFALSPTKLKPMKVAGAAKLSRGGVGIYRLNGANVSQGGIDVVRAKIIDPSGKKKRSSAVQFFNIRSRYVAHGPP